MLIQKYSDGWSIRILLLDQPDDRIVGTAMARRKRRTITLSNSMSRVDTQALPNAIACSTRRRRPARSPAPYRPFLMKLDVHTLHPCLLKQVGAVAADGPLGRWPSESLRGICAHVTRRCPRSSPVTTSPHLTTDGHDTNGTTLDDCCVFVLSLGVDGPSPLSRRNNPPYLPPPPPRQMVSQPPPSRAAARCPTSRQVVANAPPRPSKRRRRRRHIFPPPPPQLVVA